MALSSRVFATVATTALALSLSACSNSDNADDNALAEPDLTSSAAPTSPVADSAGSDDSTEVTEVTTVEETVEETVEQTVEETTATQENLGPCEWPDINDVGRGEFGSLYCDGEWAAVGIANSGMLDYIRWDGAEWVSLETVGETSTGFDCYDVDYWREQGAPPAISEQLIACDA